MISATSFSLTHSPPPPHLLLTLPTLKQTSFAPLSPSHSLTHSWWLLFLCFPRFLFIYSFIFFDFIFIFLIVLSSFLVIPFLWKFQIQVFALFKRYLGNITAPRYFVSISKNHTIYFHWGTWDTFCFGPATSTTYLFLNLFSSQSLVQISKFLLVHNLSYEIFTTVLKICGQKILQISVHLLDFSSCPVRHVLKQRLMGLPHTCRPLC